VIGWAGRGLVSALLCAAVVVGTGGTASAAFTDAETGSTTVGTATVAGVTNQKGTTNGCPATGSTVSLTWTASTTARVTSYRLVDNGTTRATITGRTSTSGSYTAPKTGGSHSVAIVAVTDYGWTASVTVGSFTC
jgi:hypothetical protein